MPTFFITDERMLMHRCEWDEEHVEKPLRLKAILDKLEGSGVLERCEVLESKVGNLEDIRLVHSAEHIELIQQTASGALNLEEMEEFCQAREDIYVNVNALLISAHTWDSALLSAGCAVEAMESVLNTPGSNAFAAIRPPGHHASYDTPCGFCIFNNVAICAKKARKKGIQRVLIVDWDIHPGQGTQYCIEDDPGIRLVSIHRFDNGHYWPKLPECAAVQNYKNTMNIPLNEPGYGDADYAAFMNFLVLPLISEWKPELILVSCGFDAALGDRLGEMAVSPLGFGYMTGVLAELGIPLCLLLEGGYFIESVALGALHSIQALIDKRTPKVGDPTILTKPFPTFLASLFSALSANAHSVTIFADIIAILNVIRANNNLVPINSPTEEFKGCRLVELPYQTRGLYPPREPSVVQNFTQQLHRILEEHNTLPTAQKKTLKLEFQVDSERGGTIRGDGFPHLDIHSMKHFALVYFYVLIPLSFTYELSINAKDVFSINLAKYDSVVFNHPNNEEMLEKCVEQFETLMNSFECLKPYFLF